MRTRSQPADRVERPEPEPPDPVGRSASADRAGGDRERSLTLRQRLDSLLLRWATLVLLGGAGILHFTIGRLRDGVLEERLELTAALAATVEVEMRAEARRLARVAEGFAGAAPAATNDTARLRAVRFEGRGRNAVHLLDAAGRPTLSDPPGAPAPPAAVAASEELGISHVAVAPGGQAIALVAPVSPFASGAGRSWLVVEADPALLAAEWLGPLREPAARARVAVGLADASGRLLGASEPRAAGDTPRGAGREGVARLPPGGRVTADGRCAICQGIVDPASTPMVVAEVPLAGAPFSLRLEEPRGRAFAGVHRAGYAFLGLAGVVFGTGALLARGLGRSLVEPLRRLAEEAGDLRRLDFARPITARGDLEINTLAEVLEEGRLRLAATLAELRSLNESLEDEVRVRTAALVERDAERRTLVRRLLHAGEEERRRIARELHDEISQLLTVIHLSLDRLAADPSELGKASAALDRAQKELHRVIYDLRPSLLDDLGLGPAVRWYAENYLAPRGLAVSLAIEPRLELPEEIEIVVFRIYQEILTNVLRHSGAENVAVELSVGDQGLVLDVEDDGRGFDAAAVASSSSAAGGESAGLIGMRERAELVGGRLSIDSEPGLGTHVRLEVPLAR